MKNNKFGILLFILTLILVQLACGTSNPIETANTNETLNDASSNEASLPKATNTAIPEPTPTPKFPPGYEEVMAFAGTWEGEWRNTTYGSSGPITATCIPAMDGTIACTSDIGGMVFGVIDPDPRTFMIQYDNEGVYFAILDDPVFGEINGNFLFNGEFSGIAELIPDPGIVSMEMTGQFTLGSFFGTYEITFFGSGGAVGEIELHKISN